MRLALSTRNVPVPAPVIVSQAIPVFSIRVFAALALSASAEIAALRSLGLRRCCAAPWYACRPPQAGGPWLAHSSEMR
jgi:hypothetical protein